ncbi:hybrid sensor histidine kinase/response regulator [Haematobacter massiliensis]|uniref:histidine kinase n=2 Tax=Haematobacter massiliensis TaxID=195105 RepID=A0A086Y0C8_9RHOB|nr:histidine kinase [Haematobacter massiliensis]OWJ71855.1 hybrid sensor histidine kinase/response regulator [Haematobacter massiliensis]OWJ83108.1 hybrid sensor histidine kinase/response regulator [Haematobacter massiliensis]
MWRQGVTVSGQRIGIMERTGFWQTGLLAIFGLLAWAAGEVVHTRPGILHAVGCALGLVALIFAAATGVRLLQKNQRRRLLARLPEMEAGPAAIADDRGRILARNTAAGPGDTLAELLHSLLLEPGKAWARLAAGGHADYPTARGTLRLTALPLDAGLTLWRWTDGLADALPLPACTLASDGRVLHVSPTLRDLLGLRPSRITDMFATPPRNGEEARLITTRGPLAVLVHDLPTAGDRRMVLLPMEEPACTANGSAEDLPVALLELAPDGRVVSANRAAREILCPPDGETRLHDLVEGLGRPVSDWIADAMAGRTLNKPEILRASRASREFYVQIVLRRVRNGGRMRLIAVLNDATEHQNLQSQFIQSQKMQAIGQLAGGVAHDFNNLLTAISGHCDLLLLRHRPGDPEFADLEQIRQNSDRAAGLVRQLLAYSRKQTLQAEVLDLRAVLADAMHLLNRLVGERVRVIFRNDDALRLVRADRRQLEQVMMNLVVNARDAIGGSGNIWVETEALRLNAPLSRDRASVPAGDYSVIRVRDEGSGIPPEILSKIFEPFFTTKRPGEGTGLGLSTVYGIVKQSGAFIFVDSVVGEGTTFTLYFPVHIAALRVEPKPEPSKSPAAQVGGVVLLVEDEAPVRAFAARALRLKGFTVLEADSGDAALALTSEPDLRIDVIVSDVIMPGIDGPTWVARAMQQRPDMRVIFVSGYAEESFGEIRARMPNSTFLPKPFSLAQLTEAVSAEVGRQPVKEPDLEPVA